MFKSAQGWVGFGIQNKQGRLVKNQIIERVVCRDNPFINWFSYCNKRNYNSYLVSLVNSITHLFWTGSICTTATVQRNPINNLPPCNIIPALETDLQTQNSDLEVKI